MVFRRVWSRERAAKMPLDSKDLGGSHSHRQPARDRIRTSPSEYSIVEHRMRTQIVRKQDRLAHHIPHSIQYSNTQPTPLIDSPQNPSKQGYHCPKHAACPFFPISRPLQMLPSVEPLPLKRHRYASLRTSLTGMALAAASKEETCRLTPPPRPLRWLLLPPACRLAALHLAGHLPLAPALEYAQPPQRPPHSHVGRAAAPPRA